MRIILVVALASTAWSQAPQPNVTNAQLETRAYSGNLEQQIRADRPTWFGYVVKAVSKNNQNCCWNGNAQCGCSLEGNRGSTNMQVSSNSPVLLEGSDALAILFRVSSGTVEKIQAYSLSCRLDAGALPFVWLTGVPSDASLSFLQKMVTQSASNRSLDGALFAISQHDGAHALDTLIDMARNGASPHLREQALFWLGQRAGERAAATITNAIENDPDGEVKKKAVFALSQLPKDEAVPKLIDVARTQRNREVRKQAFFWLGQSRDPRALAYIEEVLTK
jgi:hypothetical protein